MKVIIVTGSVGTGKTTLAKRLAKKLDYAYIDASDLISKYKIYSGYDKKRDCKLVDIKKLNTFLIKLIQYYKDPSNKRTNDALNNKKLETIKKDNSKINGIIIDSHLSHYLPLKYVDLCIVTKCSLKTLEKRLKKRKYSKEKIRENIDCEIFDICLNEAREGGHKPFVINTTKPINISDISLKLKWN